MISRWFWCIYAAGNINIRDMSAARQKKPDRSEHHDRYIVRNAGKYIGDPHNVIARSGWETAVFRWMDGNPDISRWSSEEFPVRYWLPTDRKMHTYWPDVYYETAGGERHLVEIKPKRALMKPNSRRCPRGISAKRRKRRLDEHAEYVRNRSKWEAARRFCDENNLSFHIWTEETLRSLGIMGRAG